MRYDITIVDQACPYCRHHRTVQVANSTSAHCFNCHRAWVTSESAARTPADEPQSEFSFTREEQERLRIYRAAIRAGLYSDRV